jgi:hypothetical protein
MTIVNALLITAFLILFAASAAIVGSMIILAFFDLIIRKNSKPPVATEIMDPLEPPSKPKVEVAESKPKPEPLAA